MAAQNSWVCLVMAYIVMAYIVKAYIVMTYIVMIYIVMATGHAELLCAGVAADRHQDASRPHHRAVHFDGAWPQLAEAHALAQLDRDAIPAVLQVELGLLGRWHLDTAWAWHDMTRRTVLLHSSGRYAPRSR